MTAEYFNWTQSVKPNPMKQVNLKFH